MGDLLELSKMQAKNGIIYYPLPLNISWSAVWQISATYTIFMAGFSSLALTSCAYRAMQQERQYSHCEKHNYPVAFFSPFFNLKGDEALREGSIRRTKTNQDCCA